MNEDLVKNSIYTNNWKLVLLVILLAAVFRIWGTFELNEFIEDERLHVSTALSVGEYGTTTGWGWHHPQLSALIVYSTIQIFGDNPVGWRSSNVFFGTATVAVLFMIARLLYPASAVPLMAASLLAFDPYHIFLSRTTFVEIPVTFFFLLFMYLILEYTENQRRTLTIAGIAMGLTIATKAYFFFAIPLVLLYTLFRLRQRGDLSRTIIVDLALSLLLLPCTVYLMSYGWWFGRGYTLTEFIQMKMDAVWALRNLSNDNFIFIGYLEAGGKPWEWFLKPVFFGHQRLVSSEVGRLLIKCNNPPFRLLVLPSLAVATVYAWKRKFPQELLVPVLFGSCYLLILMAQRPMFSYSSTVLIPFAYCAVARTVTLCAQKLNKEAFAYGWFHSATLLWGMYMFPILSARLTPLAPYRPVLSIVRYMSNF